MTHSEQQSEIDKLRAFDQMLSEAPHVNERWLSMKAEAEAEQQRNTAIKKDLEPMVYHCLSQIKAVQEKYEIPEEDAEVLWDLLAETVEPIIDEEAP